MLGSLGYDIIRGTQEQTEVLKNITSDISNAHTLGYKKVATNFSETLNGQIAKYKSSDFSQGSLRRTGDLLDVAIEGKGLFEVELPDGRRAYTRVGRFQLSSEGELVTMEGYRVLPQVEKSEKTNSTLLDLQNFSTKLGVNVPKLVIPHDLTPVIEEDGTVYGINENDRSSSEKIKLGKISVVAFNNPDGLESIHKGYYTQTNSSGLPIELKPGVSESIHVKQGYVEGSNVDMAETFMQLSQMRNLISAQFKALKTIDKIYESIGYTMAKSV